MQAREIRSRDSGLHSSVIILPNICARTYTCSTEERLRGSRVSCEDVFLFHRRTSVWFKSIVVAGSKSNVRGSKSNVRGSKSNVRGPKSNVY